MFNGEHGIPCEDLIRQLEECHKSSFIQKATGKCTPIKQEVTDCMHQARLASERQKILEKRKRTWKFAEKRKELYEEEFGENGYLKKVIEKERAMKGSNGGDAGAVGDAGAARDAAASTASTTVTNTSSAPSTTE